MEFFDEDTDEGEPQSLLEPPASASDIEVGR